MFVITVIKLFLLRTPYSVGKYVLKLLITFAIITNMGKDKKKGVKGNVFKVAGAKSLKKTKAKAVNLGLKNLKQKVADIDKQFLDISKSPKPKQESKPAIQAPQKKNENKVTKEEVESAADKIVKMDL